MSYETQIERLHRMWQDAEASEPWKIEALESAIALMRASDEVQDILAENARLRSRCRQLLLSGIESEFSLASDIRADADELRKQLKIAQASITSLECELLKARLNASEEKLEADAMLHGGGCPKCGKANGATRVT